MWRISVPMRQRYVDRVYIVSSADFMSLYAANNILKGVVNYSDERNLLEALYLIIFASRKKNV